MNILSIGNSFSTDAQRYLNKIAKADGFNLSTFNLCISGAPISLHYRNMINEEREYILEMNGERTGFKVSLKEALLNRNWDVITFHQASDKAIDYEEYQPYLDKLVEYVKLCVPKAKIVIYQTWAYEQDSYLLNVELGYNDHKDMFKDLENAYDKAYKATKADYVIPAGKLLQKLIESGIKKVHRDTYHLSYGLGRYAVGLLWYCALTGNDIKNNTFCDFDEEVSEKEIEIAKKCVAEICSI